MDNERTYPIKVVARRTGLTAHAIRAWEKRYGAVEPVRTPTNRRVYTEEHLQRLLLLARATRAGYSIGQVAKLPTERLVEMVKEVDADAGVTPDAPAGTVPEMSEAKRHSPDAHLEAEREVRAKAPRDLRQLGIELLAFDILEKDAKAQE